MRLNRNLKWTLAILTIILLLCCSCPHILPTEGRLQSYTVAINSLNANKKIVLGLTVGWNLISIPLVLSNNSIGNVLASINGCYDSVQYYNVSDESDPWKVYCPGKPDEMNSLKTIDNRMGFWLHLTKNGTIIMNGSIPVSTKITLKRGWNIMGYPSIKNRTVSELFINTPTDVYYEVQRYDDKEPYFLHIMNRTGEVFHMALGYWVYISRDWSLTMNWQ